MRTALCLAVLFALYIPAPAQQAALRADANPAAEAEIKALELKLAEWILHGQWEEYEHHLASDYLHTGYNGQVEGKEEILAALRDEHRKVIVMELEPADQRVYLYGNTALSNAEITLSVRESGQLKTHRIRVTDVFVRHEGTWYLTARQETNWGK